MKTSDCKRTYLALTLFGVFLSALVGCGAIARGADTASHKKAFIAYVRDYENVNSLEGVDNDAQKLADVLSARMGYEVVLFANTASDGEDNPKTSARDSFERKFNDWVKTLRSGDDAVVYLTGHGVLDNDKNVHYAFSNIKGVNGRADNIEEAAYPMATLRDSFNSSAASSKLLLLDCCHSGALGERDADESLPLATSSEVADVFKKAKNVTIFASSQGKELSHMLPEKNHSVFTFWLLYALRGYADDNFDGEITLEELEEYVTLKITGQSPQLSNSTANESLTFKPLPSEMKTRITEIAELLAWEIKERNRALKLGVPEFSFGDDDNEIDRQGGDFPKRLAKNITNAYKDRAKKDELGGVIAYDRAMEMLTGLEVGTLSSSKVNDAVLKGMKIETTAGSGSCALVAGRISRGSETAVANLQMSCVDLESGEEFGSIHCATLLSADDLASLGDSFQQKPRNTEDDEKKREIQEKYEEVATADYVEREGREPNFGVREEIRQEAASVAAMVTYADARVENHPLESQDAFCKVSFLTRRYNENADVARNYEREDEVTFSNGEARFELNVGTEFAIKIENTQEQNALISVLVDGRDTLFNSSEGEGNEGRLGPRREEYKSAGLWFLDPKKPTLIKGFTIRDKSEFGSFRIVDLETNPNNGARTTYGDQTGCITILVWGGDERGSGVDAGKIGRVNLTSKKVIRGELVAKYTIFYDSKTER